MMRRHCLNLALLSLCVLTSGVSVTGLAATPARKPPAAKPKLVALKPRPGKPTPQVDMSLRPLFQKAKAAFLSHDATTAMPMFNALIAKMKPVDPNMSAALDMRGQLYYQAQDYDAAARDFRQSMTMTEVLFGKTDNRLFLSQAFLGQIEYLRGNRDAARTLLTAALAKEKQDNPLTRRLKNQLAQVDRLDNAPDYVAILPRQIHRWRDDTGPIMVYLPSGAGLKGWNPENLAVLQRAFETWRQAMGNRVRFAYTDNPNASDVRINWLEAPVSEPEDPNRKVMGRYEDGIRNNTLFRADLNFSLISTVGTPNPPQVLYSVMLHEIGHLLGIRGHSPDPGDVMYPESHGIGLSNRDVNTMRAIYNQSPSVSNPQGIRLAQYRELMAKTDAGREAFRRGDYSNAIALLSAVHQAYPLDSYATYLLGISSLNARREPDALHYCELAAGIPTTPYRGDALACIAIARHNLFIRDQGQRLNWRQEIPAIQAIAQRALAEPGLSTGNREKLQTLLNDLRIFLK